MLPYSGLFLCLHPDRHTSQSNAIKMAEKKDTKKANVAADDPIMNLRFTICPRHSSGPPEGDPKIVEFPIPARLDFSETAVASVSKPYSTRYQ